MHGTLRSTFCLMALALGMLGLSRPGSAQAPSTPLPMMDMMFAHESHLDNLNEIFVSRIARLTVTTRR
jgi:hypothetical protein